MRHIAILITIILTSQLANAQTPKAVFKGLAENDIVKNTERFEKISDKTREKMPEMCYLAEAALLNMPNQMGTNKIQGYEILATHIDDIRSSANAEKTFHGLDITLEQVITNIEINSFDYVMSLDTERSYVIYINWAKRGNHPYLAELESRLEELRYAHTLASSSIEDCDFFLSNYPESKHFSEINNHRTTLLYNEAMASGDESRIESFIANYPDYPETPHAKHHLMTMRYNRIFGGEEADIAQMKWFVERYPDHEELSDLKQRMADIEFETLPSTTETLSAFIAYYGDVTQRSEAQRRLHLAMVFERGSIRDFVDYVRTYGYDQFYSMMTRHIWLHYKRHVITTDLSDVTLLRFAAEDGLVGYMDFDGNIIIEPIYDAKQVDFGIAHYNNAMLSEFTTDRQYVAVRLHGAWGVINNLGESVVEHRYKALTIFNNQIYAATESAESESEDYQTITYICDIYETDGQLTKSGERCEFSTALAHREFIDSSGIMCGNYLTPKYYIEISNNTIYLVDSNGNGYPTEWTFVTGVTNDIAVVDVKSEDGDTKRYFANLSTRELIEECPYSRVYPMSCGLAAVFVDGAGYGFINEELKLQIPAQYALDQATRFNCGLMVVHDNDGTYSLINTKGDTLFTTHSEIEDVQASENHGYNQPGLFLLSDGTLHTLIDTTGSVLAIIESHNKPWVEGIELVTYNNTRVKFNFGEEQPQDQE